MAAVSAWDVEMAVAMLVDFGDLVRSSPGGLKLVGETFLVSAAWVHYLLSNLEVDSRVPAWLGVASLFVPAKGEGVVRNLIADVEVFEIVLNGIRLCGGHFGVFFEICNLSLTDLGRSSVGPFGGRIVDGIFGAPEVFNPVVLLGIDVASKDLGNALVGSFCAAVGLLVECGGGKEVDTVGLVEGIVEIGDELRSSIGDDFPRNAMSAVDMLDEGVADVSCRVPVLKGCRPDGRRKTIDHNKNMLVARGKREGA